MIEILNGSLSILVALVLLTWGGNWACVLLLERTKLIAARDILLKEAQAREEVARRELAVACGTHQIPFVPSQPGPSNSGRWIGNLERVLLVAGLLAGSWEVLAGVVALKTVARFKEIDQQIHAEYFLVGSLFSLAWAFMVARAWVFYDQRWGAHVYDWLFKFVG